VARQMLPAAARRLASVRPNVRVQRLPKAFRWNTGLSVADERIHDAADALTIFERAPLQNTLSHKANLLKDAHGRGIPLENGCFKPQGLRISEDMSRHGTSGGKGNAFAPLRFTKPVPELASMTSDAFSSNDAYATDNRAFKLDCNADAWLRLAGYSKPAIGVGFCVRVQKHFGEVAPGLLIVCITHQGSLVFWLPFAKTAAGKTCAHGMKFRLSTPTEPVNRPTRRGRRPAGVGSC
jgi:hypothetical protein